MPYKLTPEALTKFFAADVELTSASAARGPATVPAQGTGKLSIAAEWLAGDEQARAFLQRHDLTAEDYVSVLDALVRAVAVLEGPNSLLASQSPEATSNAALLKKLPPALDLQFELWKSRLMPAIRQLPRRSGEPPR
jgi:hypothetical protein